MAAASEAQFPQVVDLRAVSVEGISPVLEREIGDWSEQLDWDFRSSADLVQRFVGIQALNGYALRAGGKLVGYTYYLCEERKGLIGNLYVLPEHHTTENENRLLAAVLKNLMATPNVHRVESQLLMIRPGPRGALPGSEFLSIKSRYFMAIPAERAVRLKPGHAESTMLFVPWGDYHEEAAAGLIAESYAGHVDATINDQYRSVAGARRFLSNIVHYPGCGTFYQPASYLALDLTRGRMQGMSLTSLLAEGVGHITPCRQEP